MSDLSGRVAVVTGGASGIGRATAELLARCGARVVVGDLNFAPSKEAPSNAAPSNSAPSRDGSSRDEQFEYLGIRQQLCDVRQEDHVRDLIATAVELTGALDILVNNAGVGLVKPITEVSEEEWDRCLDTNLKGAFFGCKHAIPHMRASGGVIVNVASNAGLLPRAHDPVYSISKMAMVALTKSLALCHSIDRIRVNAVCPGPVGDTGMMNADLEAADDPEALRRQMIDASPLARAWDRMIDPNEIAESVLYLVSDAARMVTGTAIAIDGGKSLGVPPRVGKD